MSRFLLLLIVGAVTLVDGFVYGLWTGRWNANDELASAAARIDSLPLTVGDWQGTPQPLDPLVIQRAEFAGYTMRRYENRRTGAVVNLLVACGRPGPVSVHSPQICFPGAGFQMSGDATRHTLDPQLGGTPVEYWKATFAHSDDTMPERVRIVWLWNGKGAWMAPNNPRWQFAGLPMLYKVYITQEFLPRNEETDGDACAEFLREIIPELEKVIAGDH
jgi:EpsI family protein